MALKVRDQQRDFPGGPVISSTSVNAGDKVQSLVQEDPTGCGATSPVPQQRKPACSRAHAPQEKPLH